MSTFLANFFAQVFFRVKTNGRGGGELLLKNGAINGYAY